MQRIHAVKSIANDTSTPDVKVNLFFLILSFLNIFVKEIR